MFSNLLKILVLVAVVTLSGCAVGLPAILVATHDAGAEDQKLPFVEIQDIKIEKGLNTSSIKTARVTTNILKKDMETLENSPRFNDKEVNYVVAEEVKRFLSIGLNTSPSTVIQIGTFYYDGGYPWGYYYYSSTSKKSISYWQQRNVGKAVNFRLTLRHGDSVLLEAHGLWWGNDEDHVAGARQLARELMNAVLKKLNAPQKASMAATEAKKD